MPKIEASTVEKYQLILEKDPNSQVFAPLAEAYREMGMLKEALQVVTAGVQRHPQFASGLVTSARIYRDIGENEKALNALKRAISLSPENLLAHHLMADIYVRTKNAKEALKAFKMVLFLNPQSQTAQKAVNKLESLTADEYDEEVFAMTKLPDVKLDSPAMKTMEDSVVAINAPVAPIQPANPSKAMERMLSLIDAFIVRNDLEKAHALLRDTEIEFGKHPEIQRRMQSLQIRYSDTEEVAAPLKPLAPREQRMQQKKLETLQMMLRRIDEYRAQG
jgi:hypothetical protein